MAEVSILQECSKQKSAYGTEIEIDNATGNLVSLNQSGAKKQTVTEQGKNLVSNSNLNDTSDWAFGATCTLDTAKQFNGNNSIKMIHTSGALSNFGRTKRISILPSTTYTASAYIWVDNINYVGKQVYFECAQKKSDATTLFSAINYTVKSTDIQNWVRIAFTVTSDTLAINSNFYIALLETQNADCTMWTSEPQFEPGATATPYAPFVPNSPSIDYPALITGVTKTVVNGIAYPMPDGCGYDGDSYDHVARQGIATKSTLIFDGSSDENFQWANDGTLTARFYINVIIPNINLPISNNILADIACDKLKNVTSGSTYSLNSEAISAFNSNDSAKTSIFHIRVLKSRLTGWSDSWTSAQKISAFKTFLTANNVQVLYQLATPTAITGASISIPTAAHNVITNDGGGQMVATYMAKYEETAKTSKAFSAKIVKELMRAYSLDFSVVNCNSIRQYLVPGCVVEAKGQKFDMSSFKQSSGATNKTDVSGRHISCRLTNYLIPIGYAFIGTSAQIAADILNVATDKNGNKANTEFSVGTCANISGSFSLGNTQISTARAALFAMKSFGVEVDFDNFIVNLPVKCGTGKTKTFEFGKDLVSLERTWDDSNGTSYTAKIADLQRIPGHEADAFDVGDDCAIKDKFIGDTIEKRIISYTQCLDDPTQDEITIGVFVRDASDNGVAMQVDISAAQGTADGAKTAAENSLQPGTSYNGVDITHEYGFRSTSADGLMRTFQNGTDGYLIQHNVNGNWVTVWQVTSADGTTTAYSADGNQAVMLGGTAGMRMFKKDSNENWQLVGGMDADGNSMASKMYSPNYPDTYGVIGTDSHTGSKGLTLFDAKGKFVNLTNWGESGDSSNGSALISSNEFLLFCIINGQYTIPFGANKDHTSMGFGSSLVYAYADYVALSAAGTYRAKADTNGFHALNGGSGDYYVPGDASHAAYTIHVTDGIISGRTF